MTINKNNRLKLKALLQDIECGLCELHWWQEIPPAKSALMSDVPFAMDSLQPQQWLQWIFIPKINHIIDNDGELPSGFLLAPYFEVMWKNQPHTALLLATIREIDKVIE